MLLLDKVNQLPQRIEERMPDVDVVWLYGSYANQTAHAHSDIDLAVAYSEYNENIDEYFIRTEKTAMSLRQELELEDNQLSVVDIDRIPVPLAYNIITLGQVIVCQSDLRLRQEEQRIWALWEHYKYEHEHNRRTL